MASKVLPKIYRHMTVSTLSEKFRKCVIIESSNLQLPGKHEILVRNKYAGINASDINQSAGRYAHRTKPPFPCGFEGVGEIVAKGDDAHHLELGQAVAYLADGAFSEFILLPINHVMPIPSMHKDYIALLVSGLTAAISLDKVGQLKAGDTVLVTAAAGGTGQFAVQWAKQNNCHVIGTCSSDEKVAFLKSIGCDRAINYNKEDLNKTLKSEYPQGLDVVYESVGGDFFNTAVDRLAIGGRIVVIGFIQGYQTAAGIVKDSRIATLPPKLLMKSASVRGFFLFHYAQDWKPYLQRLSELYNSGLLKVNVDNGREYEHGPFIGLESIYDAVEYLYTKKSRGKIVVQISPTSSL